MCSPRLSALLCGIATAAATASRCSVINMMGSSPLDGATARKTGVRRRSAATRIATTKEVRDAVVEESTTLGTVHELNSVSLSKYRCHSVTDDAPPDVNPFDMVADDIATLNDDVCSELDGKDVDLVGSAQHFFGTGNTREGKRVRPVIVSLMGQATMASASLSDEQQQTALSKHRRLAAITEMIHTASLVHDDVLDGADTRRGGSAVHRLYSSKAAVFSGDFLLARASVVTGVSSKSKFVPSTVASQLRFKSPSYGAALTPYKLSQPMPVSKKRGGPKSK